MSNWKTWISQSKENKNRALSKALFLFDNEFMFDNEIS